MTSLATRHSPLATSRTITVAGIQTSYGEDMQANIKKTIDFVREAAAKGAVLRYVARLEGGSARVGLEALPPSHPLAQGGACDNRVAIWSCRYAERPLVIQGPGAGAGVTAAALLDDIRRAISPGLRRGS